MEVSTGDIVCSLAGHDAGSLFFVVEAGPDSVLLADGKRRRVENPKRKNRKHVSIVARTDSRVADQLRQGDKVTNSELRRELAACRRRSGQNQGGQ